MDKLRAIHYFNRAVETGSFSAAARSLEVTTPAVTQLVGLLERELGVTLFHRTVRGLSLTADGGRYYQTSRRVATDLEAVEQHLGQRGANPRGTLTVGMRPALGHHCIMPRIASLLVEYPELELVVKPVATLDEIDGKKLDLLVLTGWPPDRDFVVRPLAQTRLIVCAAPGYWAREGRPQAPEDLARHHCLVYRGTPGVLLDRWAFEKGREQRTVDVRSRLLSDDRLWLEDAACAGAGVIRVPDLTVGRYLAGGSLVPVLEEWESLEAPMIFAAYRPRLRQSRLVRLFVDFLVDLFRDLERRRLPVPPRGIRRVPRPKWFGHVHGRHSAYVGRARKRG